MIKARPGGHEGREGVKAVKFWAVSTKYFDSGRVKINIYPVEA